MFHQLIESGTRRRGHTGWTLASTGVHALLIAGAITATLKQASPRIDAEPAVPLPFYVIPAPPRRDPTPAMPPRTSASPGIQAHTQIPVELPPIPKVGIPIDQQLRVGEPIAVASRGNFALPDTVDGRVYQVALVERPVEPRRGNGQPTYPRRLRSASIEGDVLVQFVVDTSGRVESQSIEIIRASHEMFAESVRRWLNGTRYRPAEIRGQHVRQLVQQQIGFTLR